MYYLQEMQKKCAMICVHRYSITDVKSKIKIKVRAAVNRLASSLILPWVGPPGRGNWEMRGNGPRPGQMLLTLPEGDGVGDWVGEARGLVSWVLAWREGAKRREKKLKTKTPRPFSPECRTVSHHWVANRLASWRMQKWWNAKLTLHSLTSMCLSSVVCL